MQIARRNVAKMSMNGEKIMSESIPEPLPIPSKLMCRKCLTGKEPSTSKLRSRRGTNEHPEERSQISEFNVEIEDFPGVKGFYSADVEFIDGNKDAFSEWLANHDRKLREQIAQEIERERDQIVSENEAAANTHNVQAIDIHHECGRVDGLGLAARIARGERA